MTRSVRQSIILALGLLLALLPTPGMAASPNPVLHFRGTEAYSTGGKNWVRYRFEISNRMDFPADMFAAAPDLPPCGRNANSSRTWLDFFDAQGRRLYGFCALLKPEDLGAIWFAVEEGTPPPSRVYVELNDRLTSTRYKSNLADTAVRGRRR